MTPEFTKSEADGWFYVMEKPNAYDPTDDSLSRGGGFSITRFSSAEAREYFIQARTYETAARLAAWERDCLIREVEAAIKKRDIRKRLRAIIFKRT